MKYFLLLQSHKMYIRVILEFKIGHCNLISSPLSLLNVCSFLLSFILRNQKIMQKLMTYLSNKDLCLLFYDTEDAPCKVHLYPANPSLSLWRFDRSSHRDEENENRDQTRSSYQNCLTERWVETCGEDQNVSNVQQYNVKMDMG